MLKISLICIRLAREKMQPSVLNVNAHIFPEFDSLYIHTFSLQSTTTGLS